MKYIDLCKDNIGFIEGYLVEMQDLIKAGQLEDLEACFYCMQQHIDIVTYCIQSDIANSLLTDEEK